MIRGPVALWPGGNGIADRLVRATPRACEVCDSFRVCVPTLIAGEQLYLCGTCVNDFRVEVTAP